MKLNHLVSCLVSALLFTLPIAAVSNDPPGSGFSFS